MRKWKRCVALLSAAVMAFSMAACGNKNSPDVTEPPTPAPIDGLYVMSYDGGPGAVVDEFQNVMKGYSVSENGDVVDIDGNVVIPAAAVVYYVPTSSIDLSVTGGTDIELAYNEEVSKVGNVVYVPQEVAVTVDLTPDNATCREFSVTSDNPDVAEVKAVSVAKTGSSLFTVVCKTEGEATVTVKSQNSDECVAAMKFTVTLSEFKDPTRAGWITAEVSNLRVSPENSSALLGSYAWGKSIRILKIENDWAAVIVDGIEGYILASDVSYTEPHRYVAPDPGVPDDLDDMIFAENGHSSSGDSSIIG